MRSLLPIFVAGAALSACDPPARRLQVPTTLHTHVPSPVYVAVREARDEPFRLKAPDLLDHGTEHALWFHDGYLDNGVRAVLLTRRDFPSVSAVLMLGRGASSAKPGVATALAWGLSDGSESESGAEARWHIQFLGASTRYAATMNTIELHVEALTPFFGRAMTSVGPMFATPALRSSEIASTRRSLEVRRTSEYEKPEILARHVLMSELFPPPHPWGFPIAALPDGTLPKALRDEDIVQLRDEQLVAENTTVVCVGALEPDVMARIFERNLKGLATKHAPAPAPLPVLPPLDKAPIVVVNRPGSSLSDVAIGWRGPLASDPDTLALEVAVAAATSGLGSRLNVGVRSHMGATYGVRGAVDLGADAGAIRITAAVEADRTDEALRAMIQGIEALGRTPMAPDELRAACLKSEYALHQDTAHGIAEVVARQLAIGRSLEEIGTHDRRLRGMQAERVQAAAARQLSLERVQIVIVGDATRIQPGLERLAFRNIVIRR